MTVAALPASAEYVEDGVSTSFPVPFRFKSPTDLVVDRLLAIGVVVPLVFGVDYAVTGGATDAGGTLIRTAATSGGTVRIRRHTARAQPMAYPTGGRFPAESHETALDRQMLISQEQDVEIADTAARALLAPSGETIATLPASGERAGMFQAYDALGNPVAASGTGADSALRADLARVGGALVAYTDGGLGAVKRTVAAKVAEAGVSIYDYGAVGEASVDSSAAIAAATSVANARKQPLLIPPGHFVLNRNIQPKFGFVGAGSALSRFMATDASAFAAGISMIRIGWSQAEDPTLCFAVPCRGLSVYGAGIRTAERSGDQSTMMFNGDGIFFDEQSHSIVADDIHVEFCRRGLDRGGIYGHLSSLNLVAANNWDGIYYSRNAFDYKDFNPTITGNLCNCIGASGTLDLSKVQAVGGIGGLTVYGGHMGFAPQGVRVEHGNGTIGLTACTFIDTRFEFIGNRAVAVLDSAKNSGILEFKSPGHSWSRDVNNNPDTQYAIVGDGNFPAQDYAVVLGNVSGSNGPSYRKGDQWKIGSSGKHTKINNLFDFFHDDKGISGYEAASGQERLIFSGQSGFVRRLGVPPQTINASGSSRATIADFTGANQIPEAYDGTLQARVVLAGMAASASADIGVQVIVKVNGGADIVIGAFVLRQGENMIPAEYMSFDIGRRTAGVHAVQVLLALSGNATVNLNNRGVGGQARLVLAQQDGEA